MVIFVTKNIKNNKVFIGYSLNDKAETFGTGKYITKAIKTYGITSFEKNILEKLDEDTKLEKLFERLEYWINEYKADNPNFGYNETIFEMMPTKKKLTTKIQVLLSDEDMEKLNEYIIKISMERGTNLSVSHFVRELIVREINKNN